MSSAITVTYYLEILSSWCHWTEPAWTELKQRYGDRVDFQWRIALMNPADFPVSAAQCDWFYQRSGTVVNSSYRLNSGWLEAERAGHYEAPNWVAEAGRNFIGDSDDRIRIALANAAVLEGRKVGDINVSCEIGAQATGIDTAALQTAAKSEEIHARVTASTAEFYSHQINQRPSFVIQSNIGDKAVLSGAYRAAPLIATIDAMLEDSSRYAAYGAYAAHHSNAPTA
jgi:predicted DsbA family dithiol-disulfide isomerase